ncbi:serine hydrolase domain-containing protein [Bosea thiooxidans]|nr:serine hydrolase [Bosea sp. (in: a-proteobacteria)]
MASSRSPDFSTLPPLTSLSRRDLFLAALVPALPFGSVAKAAGSPVPERYLDAVNPTALMVMRQGRLVASHGEPTRKISVASVRKSLLGGLYGIAVAEGRIKLDATLCELGIDDVAPALTAEEKRATVADLLMARSGIYHVAGYETAEQRRTRPERGSHPPGSFWFYNNWDFNALATIYRQQTGEDIFESFERRIARPIGMQDFTVSDGRFIGDARSRHPAYVFSLSARDMLRFGEMVLGGGAWQGRQVVPRQWLADSLTAHSQTPRGHLGYGYLWWVLDPAVFGPGAGIASGYGGQHIAVVPRQGLVVVQTVEQRGRRARTSGFVRLLRELVES